MVLPGLMTRAAVARSTSSSNDRVARASSSCSKLDENPTIREQWQDATEGKGSLTVWLGNLLQKKLDVKPSRGITATSSTSTSAAPTPASRPPLPMPSPVPASM